MPKELQKGASVKDMIGYLVNLKEQPGWKIVSKMLEGDIKDVESKLNGDTDLSDNETIKTLQDKRRDRIRLRDMPDDLIKDWEERDIFPPQLDPFE